jgi:hypothetical protein
VCSASGDQLHWGEEYNKPSWLQCSIGPNTKAIKQQKVHQLAKENNLGLNR